LARVRAHRAADELIKRATGNQDAQGKWCGCAVACTLNRYNHAGYEDEMGIPRALAQIEDGIFENLPEPAHLDWPEQFLEAIPVGADLTGVADRFMHWLLVHPFDGVLRFAHDAKKRKAIQDVADLYERRINGEMIACYEWKKAYAAYAAAAYAAAAYAAYAAYAAAAYAAYAAGGAAAACADIRINARAVARIKQAEKLRELLARAPVPEMAIADRQ
jgi:hypothetical protein